MDNSSPFTAALCRLLRQTPALLLLPLALLSAPSQSKAQQPPPPPPAAPAFLPPPIPPSLSASRGLPLSEAVRLILEDVLKKPFILSPEIVADSRSVGVSSKLDPKTAEIVLDRLLKDAGYTIDRTPAFYAVKPLPPDNNQRGTPDGKKPLDSWLTYRPKHRPVSYFASTLPALFPEARFSFDKNTSNNSAQTPDVFYAALTDSDRRHFLDIVSTLDVPVQRVQIRAALYETTTDNRDGSGVRLAASLLSSRLGISIESQGSGQSLTLKTPNIDLALSALAADSRFHTLSLPALILEHGATGDFRVGTRIPLQKTVISEGGNATTTVEYQDVGTLVTVSPVVSGSTITADISLELSDVAQTSVGTSTAPTLLTRNLKLRTALPTGTAVLLGNLRSERNDSSSTGLFGFRLGSQDSKTQTDLVLLLYAEIVNETPHGGSAD